jgi:hypothetical protein
MLIGYMRVSSSDERQSVALQRDALLRPEWKFIGRVLPANPTAAPKRLDSPSPNALAGT